MRWRVRRRPGAHSCNCHESRSGSGSRCGFSVSNSGQSVINGLQPVHPVGQAQRGVDALTPDIVPCPPGGAPARHQAGIGMQHRPVRLKPEAWKECHVPPVSDRRSIASDWSACAAMTTLSNQTSPSPAIDRITPPWSRRTPVMWVFRWMRPPSVPPSVLSQAVYIFARPALHRAPLRTINEIQQLVIFHELEEASGPDTPSSSAPSMTR